MGIFTFSPEAIRPSSFDAFVDNLISEGTRKVVARQICDETFVDVVDRLSLIHI